MNLTINLKDMPFNLTLEKGQELFLLAEAGKAYGIRRADQEAFKQLYTVDELANRLKCHRNTVLKAIHDKRLRTTTVGESKGYVVTEKAVREFLGDI